MEFSWRFLSICYNRTGAFLVAGIYLIEYNRGFVILLVNLLVRLTVFRCFSVFQPLWLVLFHTVDVSISVLLCLSSQVQSRWPTFLKALQANCYITCTRTKDKKHKRNISLNVT